MKTTTGYCLTVMIVASTLFVQFSCNTAFKSLNSGNYDAAIMKSVKRLRNNTQKEKFILILEEAYLKANDKDLLTVNYFKKEGNPDNWPKIYDLYYSMQRRQALVQPLLPLRIPSENRIATFKIVNYDEEIIQAKKKAAEYYYEHAMELLKKNNRLDARQAYYELLELKSLSPNYKDINEQINRAKFEGTNKVIFEMVNTTGVPLPPDFEYEITKISLYELNTTWINYYTTYDTGLYYDYSIIVSMGVISVGPEQLKEKEYTEQQKVQDGFTYQLDDKGNVVKDTSGNDIKIPKFKTIKAIVTETQQKKAATISGEVEFYNNHTRQLIKTIPVTSHAIFEHAYATANGNLDALSKETKLLLKKKPLPFPNDFELLAQAARTLNPMVKDAIWNNKYLITE